MVLFISGSYPDSPDGIANSAQILLENMEHIVGNDRFTLLTTRIPEIENYVKKNERAKTLYLENWKCTVKNIQTLLGILDSNDINVIHIEYPGTCYGKTFFVSWIPFIVKVQKKYKNIKIYLRLHEFTNARLLRKIAILPLIMFSDSVYIPSLLDRKNVERIIGNKAKQTIIGTNISVFPLEDKVTNEDIVISYFGYIYHGKGIKRMFEMWKHIHELDKNNRIKFKIIGELDPNGNSKFANYHKQAYKWLVDYDLKDIVEITGFLSDEDVSKEIQKSNFATLLYEDGLTLRRGSFIAYLTHGIPIITSLGDKECEQLFAGHGGVVMCNDESDAIEKVFEWCNMSADEIKELKDDNMKLSTYFSWNNIAEKLLKDYGIL